MLILKILLGTTLTALCLALITTIVKRAVWEHRKTVKNLSTYCKRCNRKLTIPHPIDGSRMIISAAHVDGFDYCSECLIDHCLDTKCSECKIKDKKDCSFHSTKREMMEELIGSNKCTYGST